MERLALLQNNNLHFSQRLSKKLLERKSTKLIIDEAGYMEQIKNFSTFESGF
jgi:hypothetical protein